MSKLTRAEFLDYLQRSRLLDDRQLAAVVDRAPADMDGEQLAAQLVEDGLINTWHAENLLKGKYRGFTLGKYRLLGHIGTGGMSSVFLAEHPVMERLVAIKVLPKKYVDDPNYLDRFKREARAAAALDHPNIVRAYDIDQDGDRHYIVMEYVDGRDLNVLVKDVGPLSYLDAADYISQAARGLQHAHDAGLIHRDVKPANCLLDKKGVVKLLDMGLAKFSEDDRPALSAIYDDSVVGTADYLAPEQAINSQRVDARADIYSLGCTFYFLLTGMPPFPEGSIAERLLKHQREEPTSLYHYRPDIPRVLVDIFRRMTIKSPNDRIQFASVVEKELESWLESKGRVPVKSGTPASPASTDSGRFGSRFGGRPSSPNPPSSDTATNARADTVKLAGDSSVNDNLTLAPLEDELPSAEETVEKTEAVETDATEVEKPLVNENELKSLSHGPLDLLLSDEQFAKKAALPRTQLTAPKPTVWEAKWLPYAIIGGLVGVALVVATVTWLLLGGW